ncbi:glycosyltransferase family 2 protein [Paraburkholderia humisilvae]|uniref:Glycosyltransferase 2-like domain-containing protein n=1 Tax=Paraburkholderia humisilvae TaxID=627669 RepID=A0A6J5F8G9_9BURK|nr:glycosyltransferase family A protein [Paraburkholderia humisilvae]CAB3773787.1 hypothetical protein LMG29542_07439 [Paraburkholderia humisilvae]
MAAPAVSIITPTANRERFLPALARCVMRQSVNWEWLVHDDSPEPSEFMLELSARDSRVRYFHHLGPRMTIGSKRNFLIGEASAPVIAHFDDDDHYASHYLPEILRLKHDNHAELAKLSEFFVYAPSTKFFGYMDLNAEVGKHYVLSGGTVGEIEFHDKMKIGSDFILFYGFSYVYDRRLASLASFDDVNLYDDETFIRRVVGADRKVIAADDRNASCLHLVHPASTSRCFSRYEMPDFLLSRVFPQYEGYPE